MKKSIMLIVIVLLSLVLVGCREITKTQLSK